MDDAGALRARLGGARAEADLVRLDFAALREEVRLLDGADRAVERMALTYRMHDLAGELRALTVEAEEIVARLRAVGADGVRWARDDHKKGKTGRPRC